MSYRRKQEENRRLNKLYNKTKNGYGAGAYYDDRKDRLIRYSCHDKNWKARCRRTTRRRLKKMEFHCSGCTYKKFYEYWWQIL